MACGEFGPGRMAEPPAIVEAIEQALVGDALDLGRNRRDSGRSPGGT